MGNNTGLLLIYFQSVSIKQNNFYNVKNVLSTAGIRTHNLLIMSLLPHLTPTRPGFPILF